MEEFKGRIKERMEDKNKRGEKGEKGETWKEKVREIERK